MKHQIPYFIQKQYLQGQRHGYLRAYTMFIDLSGFTPLTETFMKQGTVGAERLSISLNNIFAPMVAQVYRKHGFIPYFAGDAFTAIFPKDHSTIDPYSFLRIACRIRATLANNTTLDKELGNIKIGIKAGLSFGDVEWGIVGNENKSFYFRGPAIDACAESEHHASEQDIVLDKLLLNAFGKQLPKVREITPDYFLYTGENTDNLEEPLLPTNVPKLREDVLLRFLPESVIKFSGTGEFRNVISLFISFTGVDNHNLLSRFATIILEGFNRFSGYFKEVDFGDKGGVMVGFFGAPISFENNAERALEFVLSLADESKELRSKYPIQYRIGITSGLAFTGNVGGEERSQFAAVGNRVNLAARLMTKAQWDEVLVDEYIQQQQAFNFSHKGDIRYKGIEGDIPTFKLLGRNSEEATFTGKIIGRENEIEILRKFIQPIFGGNFVGMMYLFGEAGIGKSRLLYELRNQVKTIDEINWFSCPADQILRKPFNPFIHFLKHYFDQSPDKSDDENRSSFEQRFRWLLDDCETVDNAAIDPIIREVIRTESVLAALVGIQTEGSLWSVLDARGRYQNTIQALTNLFKAESLVRPTVIELENGQWFDENSKMLLIEFIRQVDQFPITILTSSRYDDNGEQVFLVDASVVEKEQIPHLIVDINFLTRDALKKFAETRLEGPIDDEFHELLIRTTNGNPFYLEQMLEYFSESRLLERINGQWHISDTNIKLSGSVNSVLLARIDRLSTLVKETVKTAAVIGSEFEIPVLKEVLKDHEAFSAFDETSQDILREQVQFAEQGQIWRAVSELRYIFKHSLLREAVYDMQLNTRVKNLHQLIAVAVEKLYVNNIEDRYVDLAFHFEQADNQEKTNYYLDKAGDFARDNFQNQQALNFYDRLVKNLELDNKDHKLTSVLLKKATVLELIGNWEDCQGVLTKALILANQIDDTRLLGRTNNALGALLMLKGAYSDAETYLTKASEFFEACKDEKGLIKSYGNLGNLYFRQGGYDKAKTYFEKSIELSHDMSYNSSNAKIVSNLGLTHMNQGNYDEGIRCLKSELTICKRMNDKSALSSLYTNLGIILSEKGDYDDALENYEQGLALSEELGNKQLIAIAIGCIGLVYQHKGDYQKALEMFLEDLTLCEKLGDKQGTAIAIGLIGELRSLQGEFDVAIQYLERNLEMCEELGYQKGIAKSLNTIGDIYTFTKDYKRAIGYYDEAIKISRTINNKLVLGYSIAEKCIPLIHAGRHPAAKAILDEAVKIALEIDNRELWFDTQIIKAKLMHLDGETANAIETLNKLMDKAGNDRETACVHFELSRLSPEQDQHREKALELFKVLYRKEPQHIYKLRINQLS